jgi:hypothetical protein
VVRVVDWVAPTLTSTTRPVSSAVMFDGFAPVVLARPSPR